MHDEAQAAVGGTAAGHQENAGVEPQEVKTVPLRPDHDVAAFVLPKSATDQACREFLVHQASDFVTRRCSCVFVFENPKKPTQIWGFYSLSASLVEVQIIDPKFNALVMGLPKKIPMALLGYMGRHDDVELKDLGSGLLNDAALRVSIAAQHLGIWGIWLNAHNDDLVGWYERNNFSRALPVKANQKPSKQMYAPLASLLGTKK